MACPAACERSLGDDNRSNGAAIQSLSISSAQRLPCFAVLAHGLFNKLYREPVPPLLLIFTWVKAIYTLGVFFYALLAAQTLQNPVQTASARAFQGALTRLREVEHSSDATFQAVALTAFNPKTVTLGGLYGEYHPQTHEWQDGLASCLIRAAVADTSSAHKWLVFDGPIDCGWIENLNTVCLGSLRQGSDHVPSMHVQVYCWLSLERDISNAITDGTVP